MFLEDNMTRDTNTLRYWIPTMVTFVLCTIIKKTTKTYVRLKLSIFMKVEKNKTSATKYFK